MSTDTQHAEVVAAADPQVAKLKLEVEYLKHQNEKLSFEVEDLRRQGPWGKRLKALLPILTGLLAVVGFWFGVYQYVRAEAASLQERREAEKGRLAQQRVADETFRRELRRETAKPLWERQLALYIEAAEKAATIATTQDREARKAAEARFWVLYWGPLAVVEDVGLVKAHVAAIERAMVRFGEAIEKGPDDRNGQQMKQLSLDLAHAIREAITPAFDVQAADLAKLREKANVQH
jgi:hypothetical protein